MLTAAGVGDSDLLRVIAYAGQSLGLTASGYRRVHIDGEMAKATDRELISGNLWRVFQRIDPAYELTDQETKKLFGRLVRWDSGQFTWTLSKPDGSFLQETWDSVFFDRISADHVADLLMARNNAGLLQDYEIEEWIIKECDTENSKKAWTAYKRLFGARAGSREHCFMPVWRKVKGYRKPGERSSDLG